MIRWPGHAVASPARQPARETIPPVPVERTVLVVAILASFVAFLDGAIVTVALPAITADLGGGLVLQQWVVDAYLLSLGALILIAGAVSDAFGRARILRSGLILFGIASVGCALAPGGELLVASRAVQGAGAAMLVPSSLAMITETFSGAERARAIGTWTGWTGTAFIAGPLVGGLLVDSVSWRLIFAINVIPIGATLVLLQRIKSAGPVGRRPRIDFVGALLAAAGLGGPVFALIEQLQLGWLNPTVLVPFILGVFCFGGFLWWEHRTPQPMMPLGLFGTRNFGIGNLATAFIYAGVSLGQLVVVLFLQEVAGLSAFWTGLAMIPVALLSLLLAGVFGGLAGKHGPRLFMTAGPLVAGSGYLLMLTAHLPFSFWSQVLPGLILFGLGLAITVAPLTAAILGAVPPGQSGIGSAVNNAVSRVAGLVAVAFAGVIINGTLDVGGFHRVLTVTSVLFAVGGIISALGISNHSSVPPVAERRFAEEG
ncbi:MFS transporter [Arthrobacter sp. H14-L1]|uniref:MFS transporter n=1 Tax=Arthrobacter sp. H14-L1 TaxID=2996697 RepID=UPI0022709058|nr:MFS transporter [Arthrobacter sp. H14-L1]MCY0905202.1 MFS transporter [Arthrobacter sp. H14-L1]